MSRNGQTNIILLILVIFIICAFAGGRHFFHNTGRDIRTTAQDAGQDLKSSGRDLSDSIRHDVQ
jgi:hypothetical protein